MKKNMESNSSLGQTTKEKTSDSRFIKDSSGRCLTGRYRWGKRKVFERYLDSLTSAKPFLSEKGIRALKIMGGAKRHYLMVRLHLIDPEGFKQVQALDRKLRSRKRSEKRIKLDEIQTIAVKEGVIAMAQEAFEAEGITKFRFVPVDGIMATVAYLLAVGHSRMEVAEKLKLDPEIVKSVTSEMVAQQKKNIGMETIIKGANQKVAFDLTSGDVTKATAIADKIATGRMKLILDANKPGARRGMLPSEMKDREQSHSDRFGLATPVNEEEEAT